MDYAAEGVEGRRGVASDLRTQARPDPRRRARALLPRARPPPPRRQPLIMHLGCVAHHGAKWQVPPEEWSCSPEAVSAQREAAAGAGGCAA